MPMSEQGRESFKNSCSIATASNVILRTTSGCGRRRRWLKRRQSEVCVHALVSNDEFIAECEVWHKSSLLEPEDGGERTREKDTSTAVTQRVRAQRMKSPYRRSSGEPSQPSSHRLDCIEKVFAFSRILDIGVNEERVRLRVDGFPKNTLYK